ncbi:MAG: metallophosphoesterase [Clostridia bacterium]|nr:metallophosphoesterase [Clostridia bacterium]
MKKLISLLLCALLLCPLSGCGRVEADLDIWVATDNHYISPTLHPDDEYFMKVLNNADGKITHYSVEIIDALIADAKENLPDLLILSGDLTLNGARQSHLELAEKLAELEKSGVQVLVIPGNHDLNSTGVSFENGQALAVEGVDGEGFKEIYKDFGYTEAISRDEATFSYVAEAEGKLRIFMLDSNSLGKCRLQNDTYKWLEKELKAAKRGGYRTVAVTHQNLFVHNELLSFGYQLYDAEKLLPLFQKHGVKCNFSGHIHTQSIVEEGGVTEIVTSAATMSPIQYGRVHYDGSSLSYEVCGLSVKEDGGNPHLADIKKYSADFFEELSRNQIYRGLAESGLSAADINLLAETYAKINTLYFAGQRVDTSLFKEGLELWQKQDSFVKSYIETMISDRGDDLKITVNLTR